MLKCFSTFMQMLKDRAESRIKKAADKHWSDGALEVGCLLRTFHISDPSYFPKLL